MGMAGIFTVEDIHKTYEDLVAADGQDRKRQGVEDEASDIAQASCEERSF